LRHCLKPIGFDGFGLYLSSELPVGAEFRPFNHVSRSKLQFFWDQSLTSSETNWSFTFSLMKRTGEQLGGFTLYRKNTASPLWMDLDVFTATEFSSAVAIVVEKMQSSWFVKSQKGRSHIPAFEPAGRVIASRVRQSIAVPSSG
jgi:hypothetical protein